MGQEVSVEVLRKIYKILGRKPAWKRDDSEGVDVDEVQINVDP
jgi:hypothetical protein